MDNKLLRIENLYVDYYTTNGVLSAVSDVTMTIHENEIYAMVGESGCGKSTLSSAIMNLVQPPGKISAGNIFFKDRDLVELSKEEMTKVRGKEIGMIFQNPLDSLNPVVKVGNQIAEAVMVDNLPKKDAYETVYKLLSNVQIPNPVERAKNFPFEMSGGMRQRSMIGMMISRNPSLIIADEPTTALDVTIQAQIIDLLISLKQQYKTSILIITHNFGVVAEMADRIGVMYAGELIEEGDVFEIFDDPKHPYTKMLLSSLPTSKKSDGQLTIIEGDVCSLVTPPTGCRFYNRCPHSKPNCEHEKPPMKIDGTHRYACFE